MKKFTATLTKHARREPYPMKKEWVVTQQALDALLNWLDADRDRAGHKYESIRLRLVKIFTCRGCGEADDLADETINRVTARVSEIVGTYSGDPALYFYGVAQKVHLEYLRSRAQIPVSSQSVGDSIRQVSSSDEGSNEVEEEHKCLEQCMEQLSPENRRLVLAYYHEEKRAKIDHRKKMAAEMGIALNALRIRAHRIRLQLQQCVQACLEQAPAH